MDETAKSNNGKNGRKNPLNIFGRKVFVTMRL